MTSNDKVLNEETSRTKGINALTSNIQAARATAELVKSTLGPMGLDKMLIDSFGNTVITNDGAKILKEIELEHPAAKILVDIAKTQEAEVGDGTTTAVLLCAELLNQAEKLINSNIHPTQIIRVYQNATKKVLEILEKKSIKVKVSEEKLFRDVSEVAMTGKIAESTKEELSKLLYKTTLKIRENDRLQKENLKIQKVIGGETLESEIFEGLVLEKKRAHHSMPKYLENLRAVVLSSGLDVQETSFDAQININTIEEYKSYLENENAYFFQIVQKLKELKINIIFCQKSINDSLLNLLSREGIYVLKRVRKSDIEKLAILLNCPVVNSIESLTLREIGVGKSVREKKINNEDFVYVESLQNSKVLTLILKSTTQHFLNEIERAIDDALGNIETLLRSKTVVPGGGAIEIELCRELEKISQDLNPKEQLIFKAFAQSFLIIPKTLCDNCGLDSLEVMTQLRTMHEKNEGNAGINSFNGITENVLKENIIEPTLVKSQAIKSASESSTMILKIDDIIAAKKLNPSEEF